MWLHKCSYCDFAGVWDVTFEGPELWLRRGSSCVAEAKFSRTIAQWITFYRWFAIFETRSFSFVRMMRWWSHCFDVRVQYVRAGMAHLQVPLDVITDQAIQGAHDELYKKWGPVEPTITSSTHVAKPEHTCALKFSLTNSPSWNAR